MIGEVRAKLLAMMGFYRISNGWLTLGLGSNWGNWRLKCCGESSRGYDVMTLALGGRDDTNWEGAVPKRAAVNLAEHDPSPTPCDGKVLTTGKRLTQAKVYPWEARSLPGRHFSILGGHFLRMRRLAWLLQVSPDISRHFEEFKQVILLAGGHEKEPAQQSDRPHVLH